VQVIDGFVFEPLSDLRDAPFFKIWQGQARKMVEAFRRKTAVKSPAMFKALLKDMKIRFLKMMQDR
jgi:hypothetical protein